MSITFDDDMMKALEADGEKLRALTGEDHGPYFIGEDQVYRIIDEIECERLRQKDEEGFDTAHDDQHVNGELALAACVYAMPREEANSKHSSGVPVWRVLWPWDDEWLKPTDRRRDLVKAAALIVAEIERLDRAKATTA